MACEPVPGQEVAHQPRADQCRTAAVEVGLDVGLGKLQARRATVHYNTHAAAVDFYPEAPGVAFITVPMSFMVGEPISPRTARTAATISPGSAVKLRSDTAARLPS